MMRLIFMTKKQVMLEGVMVMEVMMLKTVILLMAMIMTSLIILNHTAAAPICHKCLSATAKLLHLVLSHTIR